MQRGVHPLGVVGLLALACCGHRNEATVVADSASPSAVVAPVPPVPVCERGPIKFAAPPAAEQQRLIDAFDAEMGVDGSPSRLDPLGRFITTSGSFRTPANPGASASDEEIQASARAFLKAHAQSFGISPDEVDGLKVEWFTRGDAKADLGLISKRLLPGYEAFGLERLVRFTIYTDAAGFVRSVINRGDTLPPFSLCTQPQLAPGDPKVRRRVVGQSTSFSDKGGRRHDVGPATEKDIGPPELQIFVGRGGMRSERLTIALAYGMSFFGDHFTAFVDANTGELLEIRKNFVT